MKIFDFGLIVPCYNFEKGISQTLEKISAWRSKHSLNFILSLVDDGSSDETRKKMNVFCATAPDWCVVSSSDKNLGKGSAIRIGAQKIPASVPYLLFTDCDLHYGLSIVNERVLPALKGGASVVILDRSWNQQFHANSPLRKLLSHGFNHLKTILTGVPFEDSQAGLKGFDGNFLRSTISHARVNGFAFDVELLSIAIQYRFSIERIPIQIEATPDTQETSVTIRKAFRMFLDLLRIAYARYSGAHANPIFLERIRGQLYQIRKE